MTSFCFEAKKSLKHSITSLYCGLDNSFFDISHIVLSPGGSDIPIIHSLQQDPYFQCYSVVDERSAAYYAMGLSQELDKPVACVCTSGTAVCNYLPGITEAYYQNVPVVAITADKNPYYQGQLETQKIEQTHIFDGVITEVIYYAAQELRHAGDHSLLPGHVDGDIG